MNELETALQNAKYAWENVKILEAERVKQDKRIAELERLLSERNDRCAEYIERGAKAEAQLDELRKQEPVAWELRKGKTDRILLEITNDACRAHNWKASLEEVVPLYAAPIPSGYKTEITTKQLAEILAWRMCSDPFPQGCCDDTVDAWLDQKSREYGFSNWIDAYHNLQVSESAQPMTNCPHGVPHRWPCENCDAPIPPVTIAENGITIAGTFDSEDTCELKWHECPRSYCQQFKRCGKKLGSPMPPEGSKP